MARKSSSRTGRRKRRRKAPAAGPPAPPAGEASARGGAPVGDGARDEAPDEARPAPREPPPTLGWAWALGLFALALLLRVVVALDLASTFLYRYPQLDQLEFLIWARGMVERGFSFPDLPTKGPGYAVFLALLLRLFDGSLVAVRHAQAALGSLTCVVAAALGARLYGRWVGVAAGVLLAVYGPLVYIDTALLAEGLFLLLLVTALWVFTHGRRPWVEAAVTGGLLGLAALVRATALALIPAFVLLVLFHRGWGASLGGRRAPRRWAAAALLAAVAATVILPVTTAMSRTTGSSLLIQGYGGLNVFMGNDPAGPGVPTSRVGGDWDRLANEAIRAGVTTAAEEDRYYLAKAREAIAADPVGWLRLLAGKLLWMLQAEEVRESHSVYFFHLHSTVLAALPGFGLLLPLAACGLLVAWRRHRLPAALMVYLLVFAATCVLIIFASRYRLPMVPVLAVFAGLGVATAVEEGRRRRWRQLAVLAAVVVAFALLAQVRPHAASHNLAEEWAISGVAAMALEEPAAAQGAFEAALEEDPGSVLAWAGMGRLQLRRGETAEARRAFDKALELNPDDVEALWGRAQVALAEGQPAAAVETLARAVELVPDHVASLEQLGPLLLQAGDVDGAEEIFRRLLRLLPHDATAHLGLARIAGARRQPGAGIPHARQAAEARPDSVEAWMTLAMLALDAGDAATAEAGLERAAGLAGEGLPQIQWGRALLYRLQGRPAEVDRVLRRLLTAAQPGFRPAVELLLANAAEMGRRDEAEAFLRRLAAGAPPPGG